MTSNASAAGARLQIDSEPLRLHNNATASHRIRFAIDAAIAFDVSVKIEIRRADADRTLYRGDSARPGRALHWLPRGEYSVDWIVPRLRLVQGRHNMHVMLFARQGRDQALQAEAIIPVEVEGEVPDIPPMRAQWHFASECSVRYEELPWHGGHDNWFYRHFDHAAEIIGDYMLDNSPLLSGRILDVGCGDGITDLGLFLRYQPEELIGIDPARTFDMLPRVLKDNQLDIDIPEALRLTDASANDIPYPDDSFDVLFSVTATDVRRLAESLYGDEASVEVRRVLP